MGRRAFDDLTILDVIYINITCIIYVDIWMRLAFIYDFEKTLGRLYLVSLRQSRQRLNASCPKDSVILVPDCT